MIVHQPANSLSNYSYNAYFYTNKIWDFHFHKNFEIIFVVKGAVKCTVNGTLCRLTENEFGLCLPYDIHRYEPEPDTLYWALVFSEDFVRYFSKQVSGKKCDGFKFRCKETVEDFVKNQLIYNQQPTVLTLKSCLYAICEEFLQNIPLRPAKVSETEIITIIADYIQENHKGKLSLSDIAKKLGYNYNYMSRCFKNFFNVTFTDFVNIYRLETAIKLLEETDKNIDVIALESGFGSARAFYNFFKSSLKISPSQYRITSKRKSI